MYSAVGLLDRQDIRLPGSTRAIPHLLGRTKRLRRGRFIGPQNRRDTFGRRRNESTQRQPNDRDHEEASQDDERSSDERSATWHGSPKLWSRRSASLVFHKLGTDAVARPVAGASV